MNKLKTLEFTFFSLYWNLPMIYLFTILVAFVFRDLPLHATCTVPATLPKSKMNSCTLYNILSLSYPTQHSLCRVIELRWWLKHKRILRLFDCVHCTLLKVTDLFQMLDLSVWAVDLFCNDTIKMAR